MLTNAGVSEVGYRLDRVLTELTAHGGPWLVPLDEDGRPFTELASGLHGKLIDHDQPDGRCARWTAQHADDGVVVSAIGYAGSEDTPMLLATPVGRVLMLGDHLDLIGPLTVGP